MSPDPVVGGDDVGDDAVTNDVAAAQMDEPDSLDASQQLLDAGQAAAPAVHVHLGDIAGDHSPGAEADAGQEHLHLLGGGVLGLVEDDEARIERAAPHERQWRHLDGASLQKPLHSLAAHHVVQRVVEGAQVGIDLGHQVAGEESEPLPRLDRGTGEDDAGHLAVVERPHGHRNRQPTLARTGRPDPEGDDALAHHVGVALLSGRLRAHNPPSGRSQHIVGQDLRGSDVAAHHVDRTVDGAAVEALPVLEEQDQLLEGPGDGLGLVPEDAYLVAPQMDATAGKGALELAEVGVVLAHQRSEQVVGGDADGGGGLRHALCRRRGYTTRPCASEP